MRNSIAGFMISRHSEDMKIFGNSFEIDPSTVRDAFQLEIIDIQSHSDLRMAFYQNDVHFMQSMFLQKHLRI